MLKNNLAFGFAIFILSNCTTNKILSEKDTIEVVNRNLEKIQEGEKLVYKLDEKDGVGIAWVQNVAFSNGTIEFDAKGRGILQKSFLGIAFHGIDNITYETIYFRPFNFQTNDTVRHIHAIQYSFEPQFNFKHLRETRKDEFEAAIKPTTIQASDWFHVKIEIIGQSITVFLNSSTAPALRVQSLNTGQLGHKIGFWVGGSSDGAFANLKISKRKYKP